MHAGIKIAQIIWRRARYLSVTWVTHNNESLQVNMQEPLCFLET